MNTLILFAQDQLSNELFEIKDEKRLFHLKEILRAKVGDSLRVGLLGSRFGKGVVRELGERALIEAEFEREGAKGRPQVKLSVGLSRPPTLKKILEHATSMGVSNYHFYRAELSEKSYANSKIFEPSALEQLLLSGLSQSSLSLEMPLVEISSSGVKSITPQEQCFLLSLNGDKTLLDYDLDFARPFHFILGPERGLTAAEESDLIARGAQTLSIHQGILRVEIAAMTLLGELELIYLKSARGH